MPHTGADKTEAVYPGFWNTLATGFLIGIGSIAPGVSGGAIAVVFNLYDPITDAVAHFYRDFKNKMKFLIPLCLGAGASILLFSQVIAYFFGHYNVATRCLFVGLMAGTLPSVFHTARRQGFRWWYLLLMLAATAGTIWLSFAHLFVYTGGEEGLTFPILLICGAVQGFGTIVPGVSSSFLLMWAGLYDTVLDIIRTVDIPRLIPFAIGFGTFVLLFAKIIQWLYRKAYGLVSFLVAGLLLGSVFPVIPPLRADLPSAMAVLLGAVGCLLSWYLLRLKTHAQDAQGLPIESRGG